MHMSDADRPPALADAPPIYLDNVTRYTGARLRAALASVPGEPLPNQHVELLLRLRQCVRERSQRRLEDD
jgi:hypothetical protein